MFARFSKPPASSHGYVVESHDVSIRAQVRSVATLVQVQGRVDTSNRDTVHAHVRRFTYLEEPLVLDLTNTEFRSGTTPLDLVETITRDGDLDCELTVVADPGWHDAMTDCADDVAASVPEALRRITERIRARRDLLAFPTRRRPWRALEN